MTAKVSVEFGLEQLRRVCEQHGGRVSASVYSQFVEKPSHAWFYSHFGTWENALIAAGYETLEHTQGHYQSYTKREIIDHLKECFEKDIRLMIPGYYRKSNIRPSINTITNRFGSWRNVLLALDVDVNTRGRHNWKRIISYKE